MGKIQARSTGLKGQRPLTVRWQRMGQNMGEHWSNGAGHSPQV